MLAICISPKFAPVSRTSILDSQKRTYLSMAPLSWSTGRSGRLYRYFSSQQHQNRKDSPPKKSNKPRSGPPNTSQKSNTPQSSTSQKTNTQKITASQKTNETKSVENKVDRTDSNDTSKLPIKKSDFPLNNKSTADALVKSSAEEKVTASPKVQPPPPPDIINQKYNEAYVKLHLMGRLIRAVEDLNHPNPTPIQERVIKHAIKGHNIVASAQTGTGKTGAYALPALHRMHLTKCVEEKEGKQRGPGTPLVLVLAPTRELAEQVLEHCIRYAKYIPDTKMVAVFGGVPEEAQIAKLKDGVDIIIATPGRLLELVKRGAVYLKKVQTFVVDECDRMLNMGFLPDIVDIYQLLPKPPSKEEKLSELKPQLLQTLLFSATLVPKIEDFVKRLAPVHMRVDMNDNMEIAKGVQHMIFEVTSRRKHALLVYLARRKGYTSLKDKQALIFCRTRQRVDRLASWLQQDGFSAGAVHKGYSVTKRKEIVDKFRDGKISYLVATDIMARGIDIPYLPYVINYDVPLIAEDYLHRIGRTGRAGETGWYYDHIEPNLICLSRAITLVSKQPQLAKVGENVVEMNEQHYIKAIEQFIGKKIRVCKVPGPWKDEPKNPEKEEQQDKRTQRLKEEAELKKQKLMTHPEYQALVRKWREEGKDEEEISLRNFKEGRLENVVHHFDKKRARKRGIIHPKNPNKVIVPSKKKQWNREKPKKESTDTQK